MNFTNQQKEESRRLFGRPFHDPIIVLISLHHAPIRLVSLFIPFAWGHEILISCFITQNGRAQISTPVKNSIWIQGWVKNKQELKIIEWLPNHFFWVQAPKSWNYENYGIRAPINLKVMWEWCGIWSVPVFIPFRNWWVCLETLPPGSDNSPYLFFFWTPPEEFPKSTPTPVCEIF